MQQNVTIIFQQLEAPPPRPIFRKVSATVLYSFKFRKCFKAKIFNLDKSYQIIKNIYKMHDVGPTLLCPLERALKLYKTCHKTKKIVQRPWPKWRTWLYISLHFPLHIPGCKYPCGISNLATSFHPTRSGIIYFFNTTCEMSEELYIPIIKAYLIL